MPKHTHPFNRPFSPSLALAISPSDILDGTRARFGGLRMETTDDGKDTDADKGNDGKDTDKAKPEDGKDTKNDDADKLGEAGKRALNAERDAREKAEKETKALREQVDGFFGGLKTLLGGDDSDKGTKPEELIEKLNSKIDGLERNSLVETVARRHKITDEDDLEMLRTAKDNEAMEKLAKRLAPSEDEGDDKGKGKGRTPRADGSQGKGGGGSASRPSSVSQVMADRAAAREAKK